MEWTLSIETSENLTSSADVLEQVAEALDAQTVALGAAAALNTETGVLSATFQVHAGSQGEAADRGVDAFATALAAAGYDVDRLGRQLKLEIAPSVVDESTTVHC